MINKKRIINFSNNKLVDDNKDIILDTASDDNLIVSTNTHITKNININADGNILINNTPKVFPIKPDLINSDHYLKVNSTGTDLEFDNLSGNLIQTKFTFFNKSFVSNSLQNSVSEIPLPFSVTIKPNSVNSKILISTAVNYSSTGDGRWYKFLLYRSDDNGATYNLINNSLNDNINDYKRGFMTSNWGGDEDNYHENQLSNNVNEYLDIANTTNPITYKLYCHSYFGSHENTTNFTINIPYINHDSYRSEPTSYIMAQEIFYPNPMTYIKNSINYRTYTFTESSTFTLNKQAYCDYLIVAGGGGGGGAMSSSWEGSGGGAGGLIYKENILFNSGTYNIVVGNGGYGGNIYGDSPSNGENSSIENIDIAIGGGASADVYGGNGYSGGSGGGGRHSGGDGGSAIVNTGDTLIQNSTTSNEIGVFGNIGGSNDPPGYSNYNNYGAGGGGAGARGFHNNETLTTNRGVGGIGKQYNIRDGNTNIYYAGGGGGGRFSPAALGGLGGGGNGSIGTYNNAMSGERNTGGGGGGGADSGPHSNIGGNGGSGIVIIAVRE